ncbi:hypothetical protein [Acinetobacter colistiniresistens]|uniref:hypothetical protein n=1 Tax=Acinetobacter colistiniresistens TaxID=280145 RepID=UPI00211C926F|nr:hypothetical protein [Acinetobacter colistiniresistens]UUM26277.1 hypothetical protein NQU59_11215 [Acinetobacter colistiniresistens]
MKYLILGVISIFISANVLAHDTRSIRTTTEAVFIGDTEESMISKLGRSKPRYFVYNENGVVCAATEYKYEIDMSLYTVIVCGKKVLKIDVTSR